MKFNEKTFLFGSLAVLILCFLAQPAIFKLLRNTANNEKEVVVDQILDGVVSRYDAWRLGFTRGRVAFLEFSDTGWVVLVPKMLHKDNGKFANWNAPWFIGGKMSDGTTFFIRGGGSRDLVCLNLLNAASVEVDVAGLKSGEFIDWITQYCEKNGIIIEIIGK